MAKTNDVRERVIEQLEARAKEILIQMEGFGELQEELGQVTRGIRVLRGEKLGPGNPTGARKGETTTATTTLTSSQESQIVRALRLVAQHPDGIAPSELKTIGIKHIGTRFSKWEQGGFIKRTFKGKIPGHPGIVVKYAITNIGLKKIRDESQPNSPSSSKPSSGSQAKAKFKSFKTMDILRTLAQAPNGSATISELAETLKLERGRERNRFTVMLGYLFERKFATREQAETGTRYTITAAGNNKLAETIGE